MENHFARVTEVASFEALLRLSNERPVVVFKHSLTCPVSADAHREMCDFEGEIALVEVQQSRELSNEIERRTGITHESPQILVIRSGVVVWNASHFKVNVEAVRAAVRKAEGSGQKQGTGSWQHSTTEITGPQRG